MNVLSHCSQNILTVIKVLYVTCKHTEKKHLCDILALRKQVKIHNGQTIQNVRDYTCILNHFHIGHAQLHVILLVFEEAGRIFSNRIVHVYFAFKNNRN